MSTGIIDIIKRAALDAEEAGNPCDLRYGVVSKEEPLEVTITSDFKLPEQLLIVPERLRDYNVKIERESDGFTDYYNVYSGLQVGDRVALIRERGGRKYFILDRF